MPNTRYQDLVATFKQWRQFEQPPMLDGAPDYTAERMQKVRSGIADFRQRLAAFAIDDWPVEQQIDWHLLRAEINGLDFHVRVLQPWTRDPAFYQSVWTYQSDTPAHEGPTHHALLELWTYQFPLSESEQQRLIDDLAVIPPLLTQARGNLTGNARDLWLSGTTTCASRSATCKAWPNSRCQFQHRTAAGTAGSHCCHRRICELAGTAGRQQDRAVRRRH